MPVLQKACCCWPLHVGASVIGWIGILCGLLEMLFYIHLYLTGNLPIESRFFSLCLLSSMCHVLFSFFVVKAVLTNKRIYLLPWLITSATILIVLHLTVAFHIQTNLVMIEYCIVLVILDFIAGYLWLWVSSYYEQLEDFERQSNNRYVQKV